MLQTCALNAGVCHNGSTYPDMHDLAAVKALIASPCGLSADTTFPNACEPAGDRLVAAGVDAEILRVDFDAVAQMATIHTSSDVALGPFTAVTITRVLPGGGIFNAMDASSATASAASARAVVVSLANATAAARAFFRPQLPLREDHVHEADVNHDGIAGHATGYQEIVPGEPERSYVVARLWDTALNPELMPRQCRAWNDEVTHALGCWVSGLQTDASGAVTNFDADIDYATCTFQLGVPGRCGSGLSAGDILDGQCAGCHGATKPAQGLDLRASAFRANTVGKASSEDPTTPLVSPGHPEASYLYLKVTGDPGIHGAKMPQGGALTQPQLDALSAWIASGAQ